MTPTPTAAEQDTRGASLAAGQIEVRHLTGDAYTISVRGHCVLVDQPGSDSGEDAGPTPTELLVGALASCVAFYAGRYLQRHGIDRSGLAVSADFALASDRPARVRAVQLRLSVPAGLPDQRRDALLAVASHCTVHNTLRLEPEVSISLEP